MLKNLSDMPDSGRMEQAGKDGMAKGRYMVAKNSHEIPRLSRKVPGRKKRNDRDRRKTRSGTNKKMDGETQRDPGSK